MSFESLYASRFLTPISSAICIPIKRALYFATLLEHGSVNGMHEGLRSSVGRQILPPTPATIFPRGHVLDVPSKKSCHTCPSKTSGSSKLQRLHLRDPHKVWSPLDLDAPPRNLPPPVPSQLFVAGITSHIRRATWPISPIDHSVMMASS